MAQFNQARRFDEPPPIISGDLRRRRRVAFLLSRDGHKPPVMYPTKPDIAVPDPEPPACQLGPKVRHQGVDGPIRRAPPKPSLKVLRAWLKKMIKALPMTSRQRQTACPLTCAQMLTRTTYACGLAASCGDSDTARTGSRGPPMRRPRRGSPSDGRVRRAHHAPRPAAAGA